MPGGISHRMSEYVRQDVRKLYVIYIYKYVPLNTHMISIYVCIYLGMHIYIYLSIYIDVYIYIHMYMDVDK